MSPVEALNAWARICNNTDIQWYLYKETLLCANGYHALPPELPCAQIAVMAKDLEEIVTYIFPVLPKSWKYTESEFVTNKRTFCLKENGRPVLMIDVLNPVQDEERMEELTTEIKMLRAKTGKKLKHRKVFYQILGKTIGRPFVKANARIRRKTFKLLIERTTKTQDNFAFYCDGLTNKDYTLLEKQNFESTEMIPCGETEYPAFGGFRAYLEMQYGDFDNGMHDHIGVGLSVEEKAELQQHQVRCKEVLAFLQELSQEYGLQYYLLAGSVLGPVRHKGFIPWDDDIDIGIRVENLEKFEQIVKEELPKRLPKEFSLEQSGANNPYPRMFSKICYEGRCCTDLWPLVPTYVNGKKAQFTWYLGKLLTKVHYLKIGHTVGKYRKIARLAGLFMSDKMVMKLARWNERKFVGKNTDAYINLYSIYTRNKETIRREWLDTPATAMFDGMEVPVVGNSKLYLTHLYGNYMSFPVPWKRVSRHVARFGNNIPQQEKE